MKRYVIEVGEAGRERSEQVFCARAVESPTGPYCLVEEVQPLLEEARGVLLMAAARLREEDRRHAARFVEDSAKKISAFLA